MAVEKSKSGSAGTCWQSSGQLVLMSDGSATPDQCVKCNKPANGYRVTHTYKPRFGPIALLGLGMGVKRDKVTVRLALCPTTAPAARPGCASGSLPWLSALS